MAYVTVSDDTWRTPNFRQNMVSRIDETIQNNGSITSKNAGEMEGQIFSKAKSKDEYLSFVARLIIHINEMGCKHRMQAGNQQYQGQQNQGQQYQGQHYQGQQYQGQQTQGLGGLPGRIEHRDGLSKNLGELWKSKDCSDIVFQCDGGQLNAHKLIVSARSEVFCAMFRSGWTESASNIVKIDDIKLGTMKILLEYMYTGCVAPLTVEELTDLLRAADKYQMNELRNACFELLVAQLKIGNAGELAVLAYYHNAEEKIKFKIQDYIVRMREELGKVPEFKLIVEANPTVFQAIMFETYNQ